MAVEVEVDNGIITNAQSKGMMFRGLELILQGRDPRDAAQLMQRVCGVCPVAHGTAATLALDNAFGIEPPSNGRIIRNLILGSNYIQSHILHFFHLAALDFVKGPDMPPFVPRYEGDYRLPEAVNKAAVDAYLQALKIRAKAHEMVAIFGGKMPHQVGIVPGGATVAPDAQKILNFKYKLKECTEFIDNVYIPIVMAVAEAYPDYWEIGAGCKNMLAYGAFPLEEGMDHVKKNKFFPSGVYMNGTYEGFDPNQITEQVKYSWYADETGGLKPTESVIQPNAEKKDAYTWLKAPRYNNQPMEVGPLARLVVMKQPDIMKLGEKAFSTLGRHYARAIEAKMVATALDEWVSQLVPGKPITTPHKIPDSAQGMGLTEAPRGALGHWNKIEHGRTAIYNAIVPTTWFASPKDEKDVMGPIEQSLMGAAVKDAKNPYEIVRIIRAYDPCLACAIHVITPDKKLIGQFAVS